MSPTLTTFLFETANFLVLAAVLAWLFFKPVRRTLLDRREKMEAESRQAEENLAETERGRQEIAAARANLQQELNELRSRELEAARQRAGQLLANAHTAAVRELDLARRQAARMSETQEETLALVAAKAAADAVGNLLQQIAGPDLHDALVQSACRQLRLLPGGRGGPVKIESARPLSEKQCVALVQALGPAATGADFRTVDDLRAGVRVSTGDGLIDASIGGLANYARQSLVKEMSHHANNHSPPRGEY